MFINRLLQVVAVLVYLYSPQMVLCHEVAEVLEKKGNDQLFSQMEEQSFETPLIRRYKLYHECSAQHLIIGNKTVSATGQTDSILVHLEVQSHSVKGTVAQTIMGIASGKFLCFNKHGKLVARPIAKHLRCKFFEKIDKESGYTQFKSTFKESWVVGFGRKGKALTGGDFERANRKRAPACYNFMKIERRPMVVKPPIGPLSPDHYETLERFYNEANKKKRRRRRRTTSVLRPKLSQSIPPFVIR